MSNLDKILWVAVAEARGHLMRAHLARGLLAERDVDVEILTTSDAGVEFLRALGTPATVLSHEYRLEFDDRQDLSRHTTERHILRYLFEPRSCWRDIRRLLTWAREYALVVNDSFHPALMLAPWFDASAIRTVHVVGEHMLSAVSEYVHGRAPQFVSDAYARVVRRLCSHAFAEVRHSLRPHGSRPQRRFCLPPLVARPSRQPDEVRKALGVHHEQRLAAVYLNPHFRNPRLAERLEHVLSSRGYVMHAVGEGLSPRNNWLARDPHFVDVVAAADVLITTPGMGCLSQASVFGTPFLALVTDQPEQTRNLDYLRLLPGPHAAVTGLDSSDLDGKLRRALLSLERAPTTVPQPFLSKITHIESLWSNTFTGLIQEAKCSARL